MTVGLSEADMRRQTANYIQAVYIAHPKLSPATPLTREIFTLWREFRQDTAAIASILWDEHDQPISEADVYNSLCRYREQIRKWGQ